MNFTCLVEICQHPTEPDSAWQLFLGYVSLSVWILYIAAALWLLFALDWHSFLVNVGLYLNFGFGQLVKEATAVPRPGPCPVGGYAFPSLHVMSVGFMTGYLLTTAALLVTQSSTRAQRVPWVFAWPHFRRRSPTLSRLLYWLYAGLFLALTIFVMISRVQLTYHTTTQAMAGLLMGLINGALWCCAALWIYPRTAVREP